MKEIISREIQLRQRPVGIPTEGNFAIVEVAIREPNEGEILVQNKYISVDPYMRGRMNDHKSYTPPFQIGETITGGSVGKILVSNSKAYQAGEYVLSFAGWREYFVSNGEGLTKIDPSRAPIQSFLGALGMPGMTAYVGLLNIGQPQEKETVYVSAASGAVGSIVCQIAKIKGCRVVGSAGSDQKVDWLLNTIGVDGAFNYKKVDDLSAELQRQCPDGIDIYFENVGGEHLEAVLFNMNPFGRIPVCGMISQYNQTEPQSGPQNLGVMIGKRLLLQGFIVSDHYDQFPQFQTDMAKWINAGKIKWEETIVEGIEHTPQAFIGLFTGENRGKMLVRV
ncbi:NADP-dependent oxidoreductase [Caldilinea sp.]|uniref:NADP-dependent oxidoreductase n=1 Tax=Caldilinea sp. TaxID=2293560 RepID=UPI002BAB7A21|nr:NADP-dependent oxidoreductase [Anaerolineales bacterium]HQY90767.1 NADP-dependent oxidoreductase [Caldilinea sp.]HRA65097.1 NADP-dependent oxidoreductase [Caldilinea sp.]